MVKLTKRPFTGIMPPDWPPQETMDAWNEAMGNPPKTTIVAPLHQEDYQLYQEPEPERVFNDYRLWTGIKPPDWAPEETQQAWRDRINTPLVPGKSSSLRSSAGASQPAGAGAGAGAQGAATRRGVEKKKTLLTGAK